MVFATFLRYFTYFTGFPNTRKGGGILTMGGAIEIFFLILYSKWNTPYNARLLKSSIIGGHLNASNGPPAPLIVVSPV